MIRFGMALMEMIEQLTKGFIKATGRQPDNLEKLKIRQEAVQRFKDMNKVVDMQNKPIDTSKGIMGGRQIQDSPEFGAKIRETYDAAKGPGKCQEMVDALKSPGAKKSYKIMEDQLGVRLYGDETFDEILEIQKTGKHPRGEPKRNMVDDAIDNMSPSLSGDRKVDAELVAQDLAERMGKVYDDLPTKERLKLYDEAYQGLTKKIFDPELKAQGGRAGFKDGLSPAMQKRMMELLMQGVPMDKVQKEAESQLRQEEFRSKTGPLLEAAKGGIARLGFKDGMTRRTFLKILGGAMSIPIIGKFLKPMKVGKKITKVPMIKTDDVAGKPEWFDALVNKVIVEGDDVTKRFATGERQSIHQKTLDDGSVVRVTEDVDDGAVRVEYESYDNVFEDPVQLQYKKPLPDEGDPRPKAEFTTAESGPVGRQVSPDDYDIEIDEIGGTSISDLDSDVSKLKEYATGKKPTMKELVQNIKRKDKAKRITTDPEAQSDAIILRQGEMLDYDDYASGGIARLLGE